MSELPIIIVGGGIGGLATALALKRIGRSIVVCEQAQVLRELGAGITIWSNASYAIEQLGISSDFRIIAQESDKTDVFRSSGFCLSQTNLKRITKRLGAPTFTVHRAELHALLASKLNKNELLLGRKCVNFEQNATSVTVVMESGERIQGTYLVGADGLHSQIRKLLGLSIKEVYRGYRCWRAVTKAAADSDPTRSMLALGHGCQFGFFPMTMGRTYWFATQNKQEPGENTNSGYKEQLSKAYRTIDSVSYSIQACKLNQSTLHC